MTHVLAVRLDNDGDVLLAGPAIRALAHGADRVTLLCGPRGRQAAELLPGVDELVVWRAPWIDPEPEPVERADVEALVDRLAALRLDAAVVFGSFHQSPLPTALVLRMAGVPFVAATSVDYPGSLLDVRHRIGDDVHEVERALDLAAAAGFPLPPGDDGALIASVCGAQTTARRAAGDYVVVHPGASVPARAWAPERNAELVRALVAAGRRVVVTGAPRRDAPDRARRRPAVRGRDRPRRPHEPRRAGRTCSPRRAASSSATPARRTSRRPSARRSSRSSPRRSPPSAGARGASPHELLYADVPCAGCRARVCPVAGHPCLGGVTVDDVVRAVDRLAPVALEAVA